MNDQPAARPMIVGCVAYADGRKLRDVDLESIPKVLEEGAQFIWLGLHEPDEELLRKVQKVFGLHDLAVEDAHRAHQRPKTEEYGDQLFVVLRTAHLVGEKTEFGETHVFVGERFIVTVRHRSTLSYASVRARCETQPKLLRLGPAFVLYALMDFIVDNYFPIVDLFEDKLADIEKTIFRGKVSRRTAQRIYTFKREIVKVKRGVTPLVESCNHLLRFDLEITPEETHPYFRDVYDHVLRINESIDSLRDLLTAALETNLSLVAVDQNEEMRKLAGWAAIIAVPTMVAGIYGMNFQFMPELNWRWGYPFALVVMASICGFLYWRFKRAGWL